MLERDSGQATTDGAAASAAAGRIDGRRLRSRRTRERLVAAYVDLLAETGSLPTCNAVAGRAGCSVRTLFDRFPDMATLARAAAEWAADAGDAAVFGAPAALDRAARIRLHVTTRARRCERGPDGDDLAGLAELETIYDPELSGLGGVERRRLLIALETLTDAHGWRRIRQRFGTSVSEACEVWQAAIDRLLPPTPG